MKTKFLLYSIFYLLLNFSLSAEDIEIYSDNIKILDNNNIIKSINTKANIEEKKLFLEGNSSIYDKSKQEITLIGEAIFIDKLKNLQINAEEAIYDKKIDTFVTKGVTKINIEDKYEVISKNMYYDRNSQNILSNYETTIYDSLGNVYNIQDSFKLNLTSEVISSK